MIGSLLALLSAVFFAFHAISTRRAVIEVTDARIGILISVPTAVFFLLPILIFKGQAGSLLSFSWQTYFWLSVAGGYLKPAYLNNC